MGTYLSVGIVKEARIHKKDIGEKYSNEDIRNALNKEINTNYYFFEQDNDFIYWKIQPYVLEGNFIELLEKQFVLYDGHRSEEFKKTLEVLKKVQTGQKLIELASQQSIHHFGAPGFYSYNTIELDDAFKSRILVNYDLISFFSEGKIIIEEGRDLFKYFEANIRMQNQEFLAAQCLKILIVG